jgi:hypothetical protein
MTYVINSHNIYRSSLITLYTHIPPKPITGSGCILKWRTLSFLKIYEHLNGKPYISMCYSQLHAELWQWYYYNIIVRYSLKTVYISSPVSWFPEAFRPHFCRHTTGCSFFFHSGETSGDISEELHGSKYSWHFNEAVKLVKGSSLETRNKTYCVNLGGRNAYFCTE